jgi:hypothetical protein
MKSKPKDRIDSEYHFTIFRKKWVRKNCYLLVTVIICWKRTKPGCVCLNRLTFSVPARWSMPWPWTPRVDSWPRKHGFSRDPERNDLFVYHFATFKESDTCIDAIGGRGGLLWVTWSPHSFSCRGVVAFHASFSFFAVGFCLFEQWPSTVSTTPLDSAPWGSDGRWRTAPVAHLEPVREDMRCTTARRCPTADQWSAKRRGNACLQPQKRLPSSKRKAKAREPPE